MRKETLKFDLLILQLYELDKTPDRKTFLDDFFNYRKKHGMFFLFFYNAYVYIAESFGAIQK